MSRPALSRRRFLLGAGGALALVALGGCADDPRAVGASSAAVREAENRRRAENARVRDVALTASLATLDLGGRTVRSWAYDGRLPGPLLRATAGDVLRVRLRNDLPAETTVHWHGIRLRNDMDGVPGMTQEAVRPGTDFTYEFTVPDPGTYFFHPHVGVQLDRGLYAPLVIDDPREPGRYDEEWVLVLDDWTDGVGEDPDAILARLRRGMAGMDDMGGMEGSDTGPTAEPPGSDTGPTAEPPGSAADDTGAGMDMSDLPGWSDSPALGGDPGDVDYPLYLANGRTPQAPETFTARPGQRVRIRIVNAGSDTAFRVALGGHRLTVTHTDGFPVEPITVDSLVVAMGERYDVLVTLADGAFPLVGLADGKRGQALAVVRTGAGAAPGADARPAELDGRLLGLGDLVATTEVALEEDTVDRRHAVVLGGNMASYRWTINGRPFPDSRALDLREGESVRLELRNDTAMFHPMHLHGHTFQVRGRGGRGARKDTVIVRPKERIIADLVADNPGQWALHCHNIYHAEAGMMTTLSYQA